MLEFLREVGSELAETAGDLPLEALARRMNVAGGPSESPWPKNVGLLFFNDRPDRFFPGTQIDVLWFPDGAGGDRFEEKTFQGPLGRVTREALRVGVQDVLFVSLVGIGQMLVAGGLTPLEAMKIYALKTSPAFAETSPESTAIRLTPFVIMNP